MYIPPCYSKQNLKAFAYLREKTRGVTIASKGKAQKTKERGHLVILVVLAIKDSIYKQKKARIVIKNR